MTRSPTSSEQPNGLIGVSHSSLASGRVQFAGSITHTEARGWVIDNCTGHYATRAYQLRVFLEKLDELGVPLEQMTVRITVSKTGRPSPTDTDLDYDFTYENARTFLDRVHSSLHATTASLAERNRAYSDGSLTETSSWDETDHSSIPSSPLDNSSINSVTPIGTPEEGEIESSYEGEDDDDSTSLSPKR